MRFYAILAALVVLVGCQQEVVLNSSDILNHSQTIANKTKINHTVQLVMETIPLSVPVDSLAWDGNTLWGSWTGTSSIFSVDRETGVIKELCEVGHNPIGITNTTGGIRIVSANGDVWEVADISSEGCLAGCINGTCVKKITQINSPGIIGGIYIAGNATNILNKRENYQYSRVFSYDDTGKIIEAFPLQDQGPVNGFFIENKFAWGIKHDGLLCTLEVGRRCPQFFISIFASSLNFSESKELERIYFEDGRHSQQYGFVKIAEFFYISDPTNKVLYRIYEEDRINLINKSQMT